jgi:hypothetical protein
MKKLLPIVCALLLAGCISEPPNPHSTSLEERLKNPLFAEHYFEELVQGMVKIELNKDSLLEDDNKKKILNDARRNGLKRSRDAEQAQLPGALGTFITDQVHTEGTALYLDNMIYISPKFSTTPGVTLHFFLTKVVDPREKEFPDDTAIDLGSVVTAYGAQRYPVKEVENPREYRTLVLFDTSLERVHAFAQLSAF